VESVTLAGTGTSLFQELGFSGHRLFMQSIGDPANNRFRNTTAAVQVRAVVEVWHELGVDKLDLLHMNCEGCEYEVIPALADAGLLTQVDVIHLSLHAVLTDAETVTCSPMDGSCGMEALMLALVRYCDLGKVLERTHRRVFGVPMRAERWELLPQHLRPAS